MTAIAGVAGTAARADRESRVRQFLEEQRGYGSGRPITSSIGEGTFGVDPRGRNAAPAAIGARWLLVGDLRLDNRDELRERAGASSAGVTDEALLLALWVKSGEASLNWIVGDFAIAIFDSETRSLTLARDITGQSPLFYGRSGEDVGFASMPTGLRPLFGRLSLNPLSLAQSACNLREDDEHSHFQNIDRVLAGEVVRIGPAGIRRRLYWEPQARTEPQGVTADYIAEYRHLLDIAVAARIEGCSRPIGTQLSSGWDSSAITTTVARQIDSPGELIAFTSAPAKEAPIPANMWRIADESAVAASTASQLGVRHVIIRDTAPFGEVMRRQSLLYQEPVPFTPNIAWLVQIRREAAALGVTRLLVGDLGNLTLNLGGLYSFSQWIRSGRFGTWLNQARFAARRPDTHWRGVLYNSFKPWLPGALSDWLHRRYLGPGPADDVSFLRPEWRARVLEQMGAGEWEIETNRGRAAMIRKVEVGCFRKGALAGEGIEESDPMSDRRIIDFSMRLPPEQLYWNGVLRPLARAALADRVPQSVLDQRKRGVQAADWAQRFTRDDAAAILEEISVDPLTQDLFDLDRMRAAIDRWPTRDWNEYAVLGKYRSALIGALAVGMFARVHRQAGASGNV